MTDTLRAEKIAGYREQAEQCRRSAAAAGLPNQRLKFLAAAAAWDEMARSIEGIRSPVVAQGGVDPSDA